MSSSANQAPRWTFSGSAGSWKLDWEQLLCSLFYRTNFPRYQYLPHGTTWAFLAFFPPQTSRAFHPQLLLQAGQTWAKTQHRGAQTSLFCLFSHPTASHKDRDTPELSHGQGGIQKRQIIPQFSYFFFIRLPGVTCFKPGEHWRRWKDWRKATKVCFLWGKICWIMNLMGRWQHPTVQLRSEQHL